ncbi:MAG: 4Fe-4S binding protein [Chloroflexi bacterium]|nr:4Fe-4S binding protein [Chloroflexota bacterium]
METPDGPLRLFGRGISSVAIKRLVDHYGVEDLTLDHLESPVGLVDIDDRACTGCGTCAGACPTDALSFEGRQGQATLLFDASMCTACGQCESVCPERSEGAISLSRAVDLHRLRQGSHVVFQGDELRCERCGSVFATTAMMERITSILGDGPTSQLLVRRCPECRVL